MAGFPLRVATLSAASLAVLQACAGAGTSADLRSRLEADAARLSRDVQTMAGVTMATPGDDLKRSDPGSRDSWARRALIDLDPTVLERLHAMPVNFMQRSRNAIAGVREDLGGAMDEFMVSMDDGLVGDRRRLDIRSLLGPESDFGFPLQLDLFDDTRLMVVLEGFQPAPTGPGVVWTGVLAEDAASDAVLSLSEGTLTATFRTGEGDIYEIQPTPDRQHVVTQTRPRRSPRDLRPLRPGEAPPGMSFDQNGQPDDGTVLDVLVAVTEAAERAMGGAAGTRGKINIAVRDANAALARSGVALSIWPVGVLTLKGFDDSRREDEKGRAYYARTLRVLSRKGRRGSSALYEMRESTCADAVSLWVRDSFKDIGGLAFVPSTSAQLSNPVWAYSVVSHRWAVASYSFAHELAHNLGARHDREQVTDPGVTLYGHAFAFRDPTIGLRTLMAPGCGVDVPCERRLKLLSTPEVLVRGTPMGIDESNADAADNRLTLENSRKSAANWRRSC